MNRPRRNKFFSLKVIDLFNSNKKNPISHIKVIESGITQSLVGNNRYSAIPQANGINNRTNGDCLIVSSRCDDCIMLNYDLFYIFKNEMTYFLSIVDVFSSSKKKLNEMKKNDKI
jgi:hypothetical protein